MEEILSMFVVFMFLESAKLTRKTAVVYLYTGELSGDP